MKIFKFSTIALSIALLAGGCGGGGGGGGSTGGGGDGGGGGGGVTSTTISGTVSLSNSVAASKPTSKVTAMLGAPQGKPGSYEYRISNKGGSSGSKLPGHAPGDVVNSAYVFLYDSDHPEWLSPVSQSQTDSAGNYTLSVLANAASNSNAYTDGDPIPQGNYTLLAFKPGGFDPVLGVTTEAVVAVQTVVNEFDGDVAGNDLTAQPSTVAPTVKTMFGKKKNTDGTQTWGSSSLERPPNASVQVTFSMAMSRGSIQSGISISPSVAGHWSVSPDWLSATFYLDDGVTLSTDQVYTVTINGEDGSGTAVTNVYGNKLAKTATGTFYVPAQAVVDSTAPTVELLTPSASTGVKVSSPIRVWSNEILDMNRLLLAATPTLGVKPGVLFVGEKTNDMGTANDTSDDETWYAYEFILGKPLKLDTSYSITISGGTDVAGNAMTAITGAFSTEAAAAAEGINTDSSTADQNAQAEVADVFGKWVRAMDDNNLAQMQTMMSGDFVLEYDTRVDGFDESDINRDGVHDLQEFSDMLEEAFTYWEYCGTTITGAIGKSDDTDNKIVVDLTTTPVSANFAFHLTATSTITSQECSEAGPEDDLFAVLEKINGAWTIVKASEGIDTRDTSTGAGTALGVVSLGSPANQQKQDENGNLLYLDANGNETTTNTGEPAIVKNPQLIIDDINPVTFNWSVKEQSVSGVDASAIAAYVLIFVDSRDSESGFAVAMPQTFNSMNIPADIDAMIQDGTIAEVSEDFGFHDMFEPRPGSVLYWQVAALGSNTVSDINNGRATDLARDVIAISQLGKFTIEGVYQELDVTVSYDNGGTPTELTFSELFDGYDAGDLDQVMVTVRTPAIPDGNNPGSQGARIFVSGNTFKEYYVDYDLDNSGTIDASDVVDGHLVGSMLIDLNQGWSHVNIEDNTVDPQGQGGGGMDQGYRLREWFQIKTTGGAAPVISVSSVMDNLGNTLQNDGWDFYSAPGASTITVSGVVNNDDPNVSSPITELYINVWNDAIRANSFNKVDLSTCGTPCVFSKTIKIYNGHNWVDISGGNFDPNNPSLRYSAHMGVETDTGSVYVPPITITGIAGSDVNDGAAVKKEDWGNGANWGASAVTSNTVVISGTMQFSSDPADENLVARYDVGSDGGWQGGTLSVQSDKTFKLTVELFNGWNYVNFNDVKGNWYGLSIYTTAGKAVVRPEIVSVSDDGGSTTLTPDQFGNYTTDQCSITVTATALEGEVRAHWNGSYDDPNNNGMRQYFWEEQVGESNGTDPFTFTFNLVGGAGADNFIDLNDANWNWMGFRAITSNAACAYVEPMMMITDVTGSNGSLPTSNGFDFDAASETSISITGTSNQASRKIVAEMYACGSKTKYEGTSSGTPDGNGDYAWTVSGISVYDGYSNVGISDGKNWQNINVSSMNGVMPTPSLVVNGMAGFDGVDGAGSTVTVTQDTSQQGCDYSRWDAGAALSVTISGTTTAPDGTGEYDAAGTFGQFEIVSGAYSFTVNLYDGFNFVNFFDTEWNQQRVEIMTTNGNMKPQFVTITSPTHGADVSGAGGPTTITATIDNSPDGTSNFRPQRVSVYINDFNANQWVEYSDDPNAAQWGALPMDVVSNQDGTFGLSISHDFGSGTNGIEVRVFAEGENLDGNGNPAGWTVHEHVITVNDQFGWTSYYKAGAANDAQPGAGAAVRTLQRIKAVSGRH